MADSGNAGAALVLDLAAGTSQATTLPLGVGAGDDLEGAVAVGGLVEVAGEDQLVGLGLLQ